MWAEMQNTLAEVELSAENTNHVFGAEHAKALEDLRNAQLGLAMAWARSEGDDGLDHRDGKRDTGEEKNKAQQQTGKDGGPSPVGDTGDNKKRPSSRGNGEDKAAEQKQQQQFEAAAAAAVSEGQQDRLLEEETEADIAIARKRREANDRYFQRVNEGVLDVVEKLQEVAMAMRKVEKESREIWSETSQDGFDSVTTSAAG